MNSLPRSALERRSPDCGPEVVPGRASFAATLGLAVTLSLSSIAATAPPDSTRGAVEHGLQFLQKEAYHWKTTRSCAACHHAATMIWAFNEARARGYRVDEPALAEITTWAFGDMKTNSLTKEAPPRDVINLGWVYVLLSMETAPGFPTAESPDKMQAAPMGAVCGTNAEEVLAARRTLIDQIVSKQTADGSWGKPLDERVPLGGPVEDIAILSRLALLQSGDRSSAVTGCIEKAAAWLAGHRDKTSRQGMNLRLLMNLREGTAPAEKESASSRILGLQNDDGGWSQTPDMASDAYATGQTLYVLARAGVKAEDPHMKRGVAFLRTSQREDGSWPMTSRVHAKNLSPITATGTAWAVLGLLRASP